MALFLGIDLAWGLGGAKRANETGMVALDATGRILDADWARGPADVDAWVGQMLAAHRAAVHGADDDRTVVIAIDAPLIVPNATGMRECEREVGRGYGRWKVGANASNRALASRAGEVLLALLEARGVTYTDGTAPAEPGSAVAFECYPYTTLVGVSELEYDDERPRYKRLDRALPTADAKRARAVATDELVRRLARLADADPPLRFASHPTTADIAATPTPLGERERKHREDLIDAALCAWTAALWHRHGAARTQALGTLNPDRADRDARGRVASIVAPYRDSQFRGAQNSGAQIRGGEHRGVEHRGGEHRGGEHRAGSTVEE